MMIASIFSRIWLRYFVGFVQPHRLVVSLALCSLLFIIGNRNFILPKFDTSPTSQLVLVSSQEPNTFNYALSNSPYGVVRFMNEALVRNNGITSEVEPALAESWEISEDQRQVIFTLREGLKWSDGEPLTSEDVLFTFEDIYFNEKIPNVFRDFLRIGSSKTLPSVQQLDQRRIAFTMPEPFAPFVRYAAKLAIMPAHALRKLVMSNDANGNPLFISSWGTNTPSQDVITNGAYRLVSYTPSERVVLEPNPYYWRWYANSDRQADIDRLIWQIVPSEDTQLLQFRSQQLDTIQVKPEMFSLLKREEKRGKYTIYNGGAGFSNPFISFNFNQARNSQGKPVVDPIKSRWFHTLAFRQAIAYAIDRENLKTNIYRGLGEVQHSPLGVQSPYYLTPEAGLKVYNYDPEKAKQLLLEAGFQYNSDNELFDSDGNRVRFTILVRADDQSRVASAVQIQQNLSKIGIRTDLQALNFSVVLQKLLRSRDWECSLGSFGTPGADFEPHLLSAFWSSLGLFHHFNQGPQPGEPPLKDWQVSDWEQEIDDLLTTGVRELDENKRKVIYGRFQEIVSQQLPVFFLVNPLSLQAVRDRIQNLKFSAQEGAFWNIDELKITDN